MSDDSRDVLYSIFFFFSGIASFFYGFNRLRRKRLIENTPTSTVRGLALGLVELCGKAQKTVLLESPLTQTECVLYKYLVEEYRRSGKSGHWATIAKGDSFYSPFWLDDATGRIMVFPKGAELVLPADYRFSTGLGRSLPENLITFMDGSGISYRGWLAVRRLRFTEWYIKEGDNVYVIGTAGKSQEHSVDYDNRQKQLMQRIKELKEDPGKMREIDTNKDGTVDAQEWEQAVAKIEGELAQQLVDVPLAENPVDLIVTKGEEEKMYMISDESEKELLNKLAWQCFLGIYGGAALSLGMLAYLIFRLRMFGCR